MYVSLILIRPTLAGARMTDVYSAISSNSFKLEGTACYVGQLLAPAVVFGLFMQFLFFFGIYLCLVVTLGMLKKTIFSINTKKKQI